MSRVLNKLALIIRLVNKMCREHEIVILIENDGHLKSIAIFVYLSPPRSHCTQISTQTHMKFRMHQIDRFFFCLLFLVCPKHKMRFHSTERTVHISLVCVVFREFFVTFFVFAVKISAVRCFWFDLCDVIRRDRVSIKCTLSKAQKSSA